MARYQLATYTAPPPATDDTVLFSSTAPRRRCRPRRRCPHRRRRRRREFPLSALRIRYVFSPTRWSTRHLMGEADARDTHGTQAEVATSRAAVR